MSMATRKPFSDGRATPPKSVVSWARTTPTTAEATGVPIERISVLKLLAEAVFSRGTAPMISAGIAP